MSREYAEQRIKDALKKTNGNAARARQQIIAWTYEDPKLLHALTKAHLSGIVAYNIERILSGRAAQTDSIAAQTQKAQGRNTSGQQQPPASDNGFGKEILKAVAGNSGAMFGLEGYRPATARPAKVSKGHIDAIRAISRKAPPKDK